MGIYIYAMVSSSHLEQWIAQGLAVHHIPRITRGRHDCSSLPWCLYGKIALQLCDSTSSSCKLATLRASKHNCLFGSHEWRWVQVLKAYLHPLVIECHLDITELQPHRPKA
jgi:hypothetical protein